MERQSDHTLTSSGNRSLGCSKRWRKSTAIRSDWWGLGEQRVWRWGGEVSDDSSGLRRADDSGFGRCGAAWWDKWALWHLTTCRVFGIWHHDAVRVYILVDCASKTERTLSVNTPASSKYTHARTTYETALNLIKN